MDGIILSDVEYIGQAFSLTVWKAYLELFLYKHDRSTLSPPPNPCRPIRHVRYRSQDDSQTRSD